MKRPRFLIAVVIVVLLLAAATAAILLRVGFLALKHSSVPPAGGAVLIAYDSVCGEDVEAFRQLSTCDEAWARFQQRLPACRGQRVRGLGFDGTYEQQVFTLSDCFAGSDRPREAEAVLKASLDWEPWSVATFAGMCPGREFAEAALEARTRPQPPCLSLTEFENLLLRAAETGDWDGVVTAGLRREVSLTWGPLGDIDSCRRSTEGLRESLKTLPRVPAARLLKRGNARWGVGGVDGREVVRVHFTPGASCFSLTGIFFGGP